MWRADAIFVSAIDFQFGVKYPPHKHIIRRICSLLVYIHNTHVYSYYMYVDVTHTQTQTLFANLYSLDAVTIWVAMSFFYVNHANREVNFFFLNNNTASNLVYTSMLYIFWYYMSLWYIFYLTWYQTHTHTDICNATHA